MKIAFLGIKGLPSRWGADRVVEALVQQLRASHDITVYCNSRVTPRDFQMPGVRLVRLPVPPGKHLEPTSLFTLSALHAVALGGYDLVHLHNAEACFVAPLLRLRYPVLGTSHGPAYARAKWGWLSQKMIRLADHFYGRFPHLLTCMSLPLSKEYEGKHRRVVHYIPNGVEPDPPVNLAAASATLQAHGVTEDGYILFAAGRLDPTKGCHLLIEALGRVEDNLRLVVVGNPETAPTYCEDLRRRADHRVTFIPFIESKAELFGLVSKARFFVFPSTVEAMSMMLLEVASLGVPALCSDIPENSGALGEHALYFRSGDSADLAAKLKCVLDHPEHLERLGRSAQQWVRENNSWGQIAKQYDELYRRLSPND